jgi:hypothetical protein
MLAGTVSFHGYCLRLFFCLLSTCSTFHRHTALAEAAGPRIFVIRHGEKTWSMGCLSKAGQARAKALLEIFHDKFAVPTHLFANRYADPANCERCVQTLLPMSETLGLPINDTYGYPLWIGGNQAGADTMLKIVHADENADDVVVLVAWEHLNIQYLVEDLGVSKSMVPPWSESDFDTVYELTYERKSDGKLTSFEIGAENYTPPVLFRLVSLEDESGQDPMLLAR